MKSTTIFEAFEDVERELAKARGAAEARGQRYYPIRDKKRIRQAAAFEDELLRRLDERDTLRAELAEARAFISTIIDAPKDYPAEVSE